MLKKKKLSSFMNNKTKNVKRFATGKKLRERGQDFELLKKKFEENALKKNRE